MCFQLSTFDPSTNIALMLCFPNCKINIGLYVTNKRADGYHDLETVFYPLSASAVGDNYLPLRDVLEVIPAAKSEMTLTGRRVAGDAQNNLVWKAYQLLQRDFADKIPPLHIYLHKVIPMGAGLGGGSADGSFMLRLLNDYCALQLSKETLADYALQLGSDCPIFIYNTPMFATGRGEKMTAVPLDVSGYSVQLICPHVHVSTAEAFATLTPARPPFDLRKLHELPIAEWKNKIGNDFEKTVFRQHPELASIKQQLYDQRAVYASMTGTGSAVYGIFPKGIKASIIINEPADEYYLR